MDYIDYHYIADALFAVVGALGGWVLKLVVDEQKETRHRLEKHIEKTSDEYIKKEDFKDQFDRLFRMLERIEIKVDRPHG